MELKKIQYFLRIVEKGSLSKAAESLYLTQPTLSRFLAKLEEEAGVRLFDRRADSSLVLTEAGRMYLNAAKKIDNVWKSLESDFANIKTAEREHIRLGIDNDALHPSVRTCMDTVSKTYPNVTVEIHYLNSEEMIRAVVDGKIDIGLTSYYHFDDRIFYAHITENEVDLVVSGTNPLAKYSYSRKGQEGLRISLKDLPPETPFLLMREGYVLRQCVDGYMEKLGVCPNVTSTFFRLDLLGNIISDNSEAVSFCPRNIKLKGLDYIALEPPMYHKRGICYKKDKRLTEVQQLFVRLLADRTKHKA